MREYYSILGVGKKATDTEIIAAYRKLSAKFHPDANANDPFFTERYRELQEAYNILINPIKRSAYDNALDPRFAQISFAPKDKEKPIITLFEVSKKAVSEGEPVTLRWQTIHASGVFIDFIGNVEAEGTKTLRLPFANQELLKIGISAKNEFLNETASKFLEVRNKDFNEKQAESHFVKTTEKTFPKEVLSIKLDETPIPEQKTSVEKQEKLTAKTEKEVIKKKEPKKVPEPKVKKERQLSKEERLAGITEAYEDDKPDPGFKFRDLYIYIVLIVLLVFVAIMAIFAYNMNPLS